MTTITNFFPLCSNFYFFCDLRCFKLYVEAIFESIGRLGPQKWTSDHVDIMSPFRACGWSRWPKGALQDNTFPDMLGNIRYSKGKWTADQLAVGDLKPWARGCDGRCCRDICSQLFAFWSQSQSVTTSTDSGFTAVTGASQYLIMPKHMSKELAEPMNINWKTSSIHRFENG